MNLLFPRRSSFMQTRLLKNLKPTFQGTSIKKENDNVPLKQFVYCAECGTPFTAYIVKSKKLYYYKCNKIGCKCNKSAKHLHARFQELLSAFQTNELWVPVLRDKILEQYEEVVKENASGNKEIKTKLTERNRSLKKLRKDLRMVKSIDRFTRRFQKN